MTAVIGILNKTGVAIAADSAVTVTGANKNKIYNTANKIFTLSKHHPIGVMLYNSASFMATPWETIIKIYRDELGNKHFDTVKEYEEDFMSFLSNNDFFTTTDNQKETFKSFVNWNLDSLKKNAQSEVDLGSDEESNVNKIITKIIEIINSTIKQFKANKEFIEHFSGYSFDQFREFAEELIKEAVHNNFNNLSFPVDIIELLLEQYFYYLRSKHFAGAYTGLVFTGFGSKEIYPSIRSLQIAEVVDNKLRFFCDNQQEINDNNTGAIVPYAQIDVMQTIIEGVHPEIDRTYIETFEKLLSKYNRMISDIISGSNDQIAKSIRELDLTNIVNDYRNELQKVKQVKQIMPTVQTVSILSKEDLAEMAESLIYLTYLKRRISSDEESVGGPIDVAIISKGDGFIWKKRKHYFDPELNIHFFDNYFKK